MISNPAIQLKGVSFTYRRNEDSSLSNVDLVVEPGSFVGIVGANGAGKSSLAFTFNRIIPSFHKGAFSGTVKILGADISTARVSEMPAKVGMVFQDFEAQIFSTSVRREVAFIMENLGIPPVMMRQNASKWLMEMGLAGFEDRDPSSLSGGQKQRLALASVLAAGAPILVLDEPTTDLDPVSAAGLIRCLSELSGHGRTLILITHDAESLIGADQIHVVDHGNIAMSGSPQHVLTSCNSLQRRGVKPPQLAQVFYSLGVREIPAGSQDAARALAKMGYSVKSGETQRTKIATHGKEILTIEGLRFGYLSGVEVLHGLDLSINEGEFVAILGQNGSGKTTLVNHLAGVLKPWSGKVTVAGEPIRKAPPARRASLVGLVFQNPDHQIFCASCLEEVVFGLRNIGVPGQEIERKCLASLELVGLAGKENTDPFTMTKGERKKLAVASMLACEPRILVLDEPTTGLDAREQESMMDMVSSLVERGHTVLFITHSMDLAARYANRIIVMSKGRILLDDDVNRAFFNDEALAKADLAAPPIVQLGRLMGVFVRSPEEFIHILERRG